MGAPAAAKASDAASMASRSNQGQPAKDPGDPYNKPAKQANQGYYPFEDFYTVVLSNDYTKNISEPVFSPGTTGTVNLSERPATEIR